MERLVKDVIYLIINNIHGIHVRLICHKCDKYYRDTRHVKIKTNKECEIQELTNIFNYTYYDITQNWYRDYMNMNVLSKVYNLYLNHTNITDVNIFSNVHTLSLGWCKNITDVSMLGNVHTLIYQ